MPEFFLELFSEEIPARMQRDAVEELGKVCEPILDQLGLTEFGEWGGFYGPRRIALSATIGPEKPSIAEAVRGPRDSAPESALLGFLNKYHASRDEIISEGGYYVLRRQVPAISAEDLLMSLLPDALSAFSWPKSMRWGQSGDFVWVRPLRRLICLLDGKILPIKLGPITAGNETEGHRFLARKIFSVSSCHDWEEKLSSHYVIADQVVRRKYVIDGLTKKAAEQDLTLADDPGLIDEVTGLVEWPVPLIGKIDADFMDLPPEVRELSMKVNQRYFALRDSAGKPAPYFAFVSNMDANDGGAAIIAGNERVLRARLSDARHFWDLDLKTPLDELLPKLDKITFHAKIGTQGERVKHIAALAVEIALALGADDETAKQAGAAGMLSKADLVTGMVGEFPELQGIIGGYYAEKNPHRWNGALVGPAIATHYQPKGPSDAVPTGIVAVSLALADKLHTLKEFFRINEKPTGSGDPYALRRAALGVIRIILENDLHLPLKPFVANEELLTFIIERLRIKLRSEGQRFDVLDAVLATSGDDDLSRIMARVEAIAKFLATPDGANLLVAYRRAANILRIEDAKDGPHTAQWLDGALPTFEEAEFRAVMVATEHDVKSYLTHQDFDQAVADFARLRAPIDAFFEKVTINDPDPKIRRNRLALLAQLRDTMHQIADFSKIQD